MAGFSVFLLMVAYFILKFFINKAVLYCICFVEINRLKCVSEMVLSSFEIQEEHTDKIFFSYSDTSNKNCLRYFMELK